MQTDIWVELSPEAAPAPRSCGHLRSLLQDCAVPPNRASEIERAVSEGIGSVIRNAPGPGVWLRIECFPDRVCLRVEDQGQAFLLAAVLSSAAEPIKTRGLGLIEQLADVVAFSTLTDGGSYLEAEFSLSPCRLGNAD
jgi:anti-sigma regulatory factor (Ser/Thr protein kinase)